MWWLLFLTWFVLEISQNLYKANFVLQSDTKFTRNNCPQSLKRTIDDKFEYKLLYIWNIMNLTNLVIITSISDEIIKNITSIIKCNDTLIKVW